MDQDFHRLVEKAFVVGAIASERAQTPDRLFEVRIDVFLCFQVVELFERPEGLAELGQHGESGGGLRRKIAGEEFDGLRDFGFLRWRKGLHFCAESVRAGVLRHLPLAFGGGRAGRPPGGRHFRLPSSFCVAMRPGGATALLEAWSRP